MSDVDFPGKYFFHGQFLDAASAPARDLENLPKSWRDALGLKRARDRVAAISILWETLGAGMTDIPRFLRFYCEDIGLWIHDPVDVPEGALDAAINDEDRIYGLWYRVREKTGKRKTYLGLDPRRVNQKMIAHLPDGLQRFYATVQDGFADVNSAGIGFASTRVQEAFSSLPGVSSCPDVQYQVSSDSTMLEVFASHNYNFFYVDMAHEPAVPVWYCYETSITPVGEEKIDWHEFIGLINTSFCLTISRDESL